MRPMSLKLLGVCWSSCSHVGSHTPVRDACTDCQAFCRISPFSKTHILSTFMFTLELLIGYVLMLIVMTFNAWLFLSVLLGSAAGYGLCIYIGMRHSFLITSAQEAASKRSCENKECRGKEEQESIEMIRDES